MTLLSVLVAALAVGGHLAASFPSFKIPTTAESIKSIFKGSFCEYPDKFNVDGYQIWTPYAGNNRSMFFNFRYLGEITPHIDTQCRYNGSSVNVAPAGYPARYACNNNWIHFMWDNGTLTVIEKVCPLEEK
jgi:hypothetical protein